MLKELTPDQEWWTAQELADAALPGLPSTKRGVQDVAARQAWRERIDRSRRRAGRGGGWEYHWTLFPREAQLKLIARVRQQAEPAHQSADWLAFDTLPARAKDKARDRLDILMAVEALERAGVSAQDAVKEIAGLRGRGYSERSIWNWRGLVKHADRADWLPLLAPRHATAARKVITADMHPDAWEVFKADYLRLGEPKLEACYRRTCKIAEKRGWAMPSQRTVARMVDRTISRAVQVLSRQGWDALKALYPPQERDKSHLHALHSVEADYHKWDVFVEWDGEIVRPQMIAFKDVYSGKLLSFRFEKTACWSGVQLAFGDMVEEFGIPHAVYLDNGREFATKQFTGGTKNRFRFTHSDDDVPGILTTLGIETHFTKPYSGQSKTIERTFRDYAEDIAKDPRFAGAYVGNKPDAKPEDYGSRTIPIETFMDVVAEGIAEHNARAGRRSKVAAGRSFDETFDASYAEAQPRIATAEQRRLWLMGAKGLTAKASTGELTFMGARFWAPWMNDIAGDKVIGRFDPMKLDAGMHVYTFDNRYLGQADCVRPGKYNSLEDARRHEKMRAAVRRAVARERDAVRKLQVAEVARLLGDGTTDKPKSVEAKIIRPEFGHKLPTPKPRQASAEEEAAHVAFVADFKPPRVKSARSEADQAEERFARALELEAALAAGRPVVPEDHQWLAAYQAEPEYKTLLKMREFFGDAHSG